MHNSVVSGTVYKLPTMNYSANPIKKKEKSLPLSVEYSTDNSRLDSLINSYLHYRYSHAYLHHNDVLRRNARVHDGCNALPDYSSGFRLYNSSLLRLHFHLHYQTTGFRLLQVQSVHHHRSHRRSGLQHLHSSKMMTTRLSNTECPAFFLMKVASF